MSLRARQLTASHGLEGTKWKFGPLPTTVTRSSLRSRSFIS